MKNLSKGIIILLFSTIPIFVQAQEADSLSQEQKINAIYQTTKKVDNQLLYEPLNGKNLGLEFNFVKLLFLNTKVDLSGGLALFSVNRKAEINFPMAYKHDNTSHFSQFTIDAHYRQFLGQRQTGFYLSAFTRYAQLKGILGDDYLLLSDTNGSKLGSQNKLGIGMGIGYRYFSKSGLYWGVSFNAGRYLVGESNKFANELLSYSADNEYIIDLELLKIGWAF